MTSLLVKVKRAKSRKNDSPSGFELKKVKQEPMDDEDIDSGNSSLNNSQLIDDWDKTFVKLEKVSPTEEDNNNTLATHNAYAYTLTPAMVASFSTPKGNASETLRPILSDIIRSVEINDSSMSSTASCDPNNNGIVAQRLDFKGETNSDDDDGTEEERKEGEEDDIQDIKMGLFSRESKLSPY